jgi:hypothetical protein
MWRFPVAYPQNIHKIIGFSTINHPKMGVPPFMETSMLPLINQYSYGKWMNMLIYHDLW